MRSVLDIPMPDFVRRSGWFFLLGCFSGLRVSDWQRFNPSVMIQNDRMILRAKKNGELVSMQMHSKLKDVVGVIASEQMKCPVEQKVNESLKSLAELAGIKKNVTTHVARHSFAVRCAELGISIESTSALMGIQVKTCAYYYRVTARKLDSEVAKWG